MSSALMRIVEDKRRRIARGEYTSGPDGVRADGERFTASLRAAGVRVIAEIKARSPSAGAILASPDHAVERFGAAYARGGAAAISVVTEEDHFDGRPEWVRRAKDASGLPVLMKDFFLDVRQLDHAVACGADAILLIAGAVTPEELARLRRAAADRGLAVVAEAHDATELGVAAAVAPDVVGVNARDLQSFRVDREAVRRLAPQIPAGPVRLAESGIATPEDVRRLAAVGYEAFLVGESLLRSEDPEAALRRLVS